MATGRYGLSQLHTAESAIVDIIFVHGLFGHPEETWTGKVSDKSRATPSLPEHNSDDDATSQGPSVLTDHPRSWKPWSRSKSKGKGKAQAESRDSDSSTEDESKTVFWPKELLPKEGTIAKSRIFTWGYDVSLNHVWAAAGQATVFQHAATLLSDIADKRISAEEKARPIIFIAHSLGGIVVKDMLNAARAEVVPHLKEIYNATYGIIFLGTPHRGSSIASLGTMAHNASKVLWKRPNTAVLQDLERHSTTLERVGKGFGQILVERMNSRPVEVHSFFEEKPTKGVMIVHADSARIDWGHEVVGSFPTNHSNMTKIAATSDIGFERIVGTLTRWLTDIESRRQILQPRLNKDYLGVRALFSMRKYHWGQLHKEPYTTAEEEFREGKIDKSGEGPDEWVSGHYIMVYPSDSRLAIISLAVDWHAYEGDPWSPTFKWVIRTPESLFYPGVHTGNISVQIQGKQEFDDRVVNVHWKSPIFSPFVTTNGLVSSDGPLEESSRYTGFTRHLESIANMLAFGPYAVPGHTNIGPYGFHSEMGDEVSKYFRTADRDAFCRAASFFSRAYNLGIPSEDQFAGIGFPDSCRVTSTTAIQEILEFYKPSLLLQASADNEWNFRESFAKVSSQRAWALEERKWADKLEKACNLRYLQGSTKPDYYIEDTTIEDLAAMLTVNEAATVQSTQELSQVSDTVTSPLSQTAIIKPTATDWTDLHYFAWNHNVNAIKAILHREHMNAKDNEGWTALHLACTSEDSMLFSSHQIMNRGLSMFSGFGLPRYNRYKWGPQRTHSMFGDSNEEVCSLGVVGVLLAHGADPNASTGSGGFATPLHCAANSGWTQVVRALVEAGAKVYTGPECSPLCWAMDGPGSDHPSAVFLRERLGPSGMAKIEEDHRRISEAR